MPNWPAAVVFDFDGVIVNSEPLHLQAFRDVLAKENIELTEDEYYEELIGFDDRGALKRLLEIRDIPPDPKLTLRVLGQKSRAVMNLIHRSKHLALPGVEQFVGGLWRSVPLGICSGALREEIEAMLMGVSLRDCFTTIVAAEDVTIGKPNPEGYLKAIKQLEAKRIGLSPKDCLVVEDAPTVVKSCREAGFPVLAVATSYPPEKLTDANWVVKSLDPAEVARKIPELKLNI